MLNFHEFLRERRKILHKKSQGLPRPWTEDPVLHQSRITNTDRRQDRGTIQLIWKIRTMEWEKQTAIIVLYRSAYSCLKFLEAMTGDLDVDLNPAEGFRLPGRRPYQVVLKGGETMLQFLRNTARPVVEYLQQTPPTRPTVSILQLAEELADQFKVYHGTRLIFLATEIAKDISILHPRWVDPSSICPMNPGARRGLRYLHPVTVNQLKTSTGLSWSDLEHSLCEYSKYRSRWAHLETYGSLMKTWVYTPAPSIFTFASAL